MKILKTIAFATISILVTLVLLDLVLHVAASVSPYVKNLTTIIEAKLPDDTLGHRPNPDYPGHDAKGFRNPQLPDTVNIVALGDSQTYGSGVLSEQSWPKALESLIDQSVYNMGLGGYGPVHSYLLWNEAMELKPSIIVHAIYAGNDLYDSFSLVYNKQKAQQFKSRDDVLIDQIAEAEATDSIQKRVSRMYRRGRVKNPTTQALESWLTEHSKIFSMLKRFQFEVKRFKKTNKDSKPKTPQQKWDKAQKFAKKYSAYAQAFADDQSKTVFTAEYRLAALNLDDVRIREGQRIALEAMLRMQQLARGSNVRYVVLLIPTKELAFSDKAKNIDYDNYHKLIGYEKTFWNEVRGFLQQHDIEYLDGLPALRQQLMDENQPYKVSHNGHPNEHGQRALALAVKAYLGL